ncbi:MAG: DUF1772 domain-containing protein [Granulosicoccus sp.]|nr:DUF1772 domain-containing protein [Granulosicoccus sp.]
MSSTMITLLICLALTGAGLMAGVYFAFSGFIMRSFDQLGATQATNAMNAINEVILRSWFMALFLGSTLLFTILSAVALFDTELPGRWLLMTIGLIYVIGMFGSTAVFNVPLNNRLADVPEDENGVSNNWALYYRNWTRWNHIRGVCSLVSMVLSVYYLLYYLSCD